RPVPPRDDISALRRSLEPDGVVWLESLREHDVAEFVANAVGGAPGPRLLRLAAGAAGNPLYLTELVDALARARALTVEDGVIEPTGKRAPESLPAAIADRLEFLSTPARTALRAAALRGGEFSIAELAAVCGQRVNELVPVLDEAILAGVLHQHDGELAFRHPLIRTALYDGMAPGLRAAWHREAARALAESGAGPDRVAR